MAFEVSRPTIAQLLARGRTDIQAELEGDGAFLPGAPEPVFAKMTAGLADGVYGALVVLSRDIVPGPTNSDEAIEAHAVLWLGNNDGRKGALPAELPLTGTGVDLTPIPAGTQFRRSDGALYETTDATFYTTLGSFVLPVTSIAVEGEPGFGADGNSVAGTVLTLVSNVPGLDPEWTVDGDITAPPVGGGADVESIEELAERVVARAQNPPRGGAAGDYVAWAREEPGVSFAWESVSAGVITVYIVRDDIDNPVPDSELVERTQDRIDRLQPLGANATVVAPTITPLSPVIEVTPFTPDVVDSVTKSLRSVIAARAVPGKIFRITWISEAISIAVGEVDHTIISPAGDVATITGELLVPGTPTITEKI